MTWKNSFNASLPDVTFMSISGAEKEGFEELDDKQIF